MEIFVLNINSSSDSYEYCSQRLGKFPLPIHIIGGQGGSGVLGSGVKVLGFLGPGSGYGPRSEIFQGQSRMFLLVF